MLSLSTVHVVIDAGTLVNKKSRQVRFTNSISPFYPSCGMGILELSLDEIPQFIIDHTPSYHYIEAIVERLEFASFVPQCVAFAGSSRRRCKGVRIQYELIRPEGEVVVDLDKV